MEGSMYLQFLLMYANDENPEFPLLLVLVKDSQNKILLNPL